MRAPALVGIIAALHILAITAFVFIQGCGTTSPTLRSNEEVLQPPAPVMPPRSRPPAIAAQPVTPLPTRAPAVAPPTDGASYAIQKGDTLSHVAKKFGVSTRELAEFNNLSNPNSVRIGQEIRIPPHAGAGGSLSTPTSAPAPGVTLPAPTRAVSGGGTYVVLAGDSLSAIAHAHGVNIADIKSVNLLTGDRILVGQELTIPGVGSAPVAPAVDEEISVLDLTEGTDPIEIPVIEVPEDTSSSAPAIPLTNATPQDKPIPYTVVVNDTLDEIAKLFIVSKADIMELNGLGPDDELTPGQKIQIPPSDL